MFEVFKVPATFMFMDAVGACYAAGKYSAIVIVSNEKGTFLVPTKDGNDALQSVKFYHRQ